MKLSAAVSLRTLRLGMETFIRRSALHQIIPLSIPRGDDRHRCRDSYVVARRCRWSRPGRS
jgi:hypothetical protein